MNRMHKLSTLLLLSCGTFLGWQPREQALDWTVTRDSTGFRMITGVQTACSTCSSLKEIAVLGTDTVQGELEGAPYRASLGIDKGGTGRANEQRSRSLHRMADTFVVWGGVAKVRWSLLSPNRFIQSRLAVSTSSIHGSAEKPS
jgi:hypothetical protein